MADVFFQHELQRVVRGHRPPDGLHWGSHDVPDRGMLRISPLQNDSVHEIAFTEDSGEPVAVDDGYGADIFSVHGSDRIHYRRINTYGDQRYSSNSQETHKNLQ